MIRWSRNLLSEWMKNGHVEEVDSYALWSKRTKICLRISSCQDCLKTNSCSILQMIKLRSKDDILARDKKYKETSSCFPSRIFLRERICCWALRWIDEAVDDPNLLVHFVVSTCLAFGPIQKIPKAQNMPVGRSMEVIRGMCCETEIQNNECTLYSIIDNWNQRLQHIFQ